MSMPKTFHAEDYATPRELEKAWQEAVVELAETWLGWSWLHVYPGRFMKGHRTPTAGPLGIGWPDLLLVRRERMVAAELKVGDRQATDDQKRVLSLLALAGCEVHVWRPSDWDALVQVLA